LFFGSRYFWSLLLLLVLSASFRSLICFLRHAKHLVEHNTMNGTAAKDTIKNKPMNNGAAFSPSEKPVSHALPAGSVKHDAEHPPPPRLHVQ
jgi:hypothetical protein